MELRKYKTISSTSTMAKSITPEPWVVIWAEEQTSGYGRKKDYWFSPKGGLYMSIILPNEKIEDLQMITILSASAIAEIIKKIFAIDPFIKLPNDVYINQKKVAGILTENIISNRVKFSVIGIGINTNIEKFPKHLENIATSLQIELGEKVDNEQILKQVVKSIKKNLKTINQ